jgi:hypothetical protein
LKFRPPLADIWQIWQCDPGLLVWDRLAGYIDCHVLTYDEMAHAECDANDKIQIKNNRATKFMECLQKISFDLAGNHPGETISEYRLAARQPKRSPVRRVLAQAGHASSDSSGQLPNATRIKVHRMFGSALYVGVHSDHLHELIFLSPIGRNEFRAVKVIERF